MPLCLELHLIIVGCILEEMVFDISSCSLGQMRNPRVSRCAVSGLHHRGVGGRAQMDREAPLQRLPRSPREGEGAEQMVYEAITSTQSHHVFLICSDSLNPKENHFTMI